jgi:Flp pilus assembly protein TadG
MIVRRIPKGARRFLHDRRGVAAVEAALLSPVLIVLFLGMVEVTQLIRVEAKLSRAAQTIQDIVAGQVNGSSSTISIANAFVGGQIVMTPFGASNLSAAIASVLFDSSANALKVDWQQLENNSPTMTVSTACSTAAGMSIGSDSVIVVQATYTYVPIVSYLFGKSYTLTQTAYGRPRNVGSISAPSGANGASGNC